MSTITAITDTPWMLPSFDEAAIAAMIRETQLPEIVARLLVQRGIAPADVQEFLYPRLAQHFPDPFRMAGMRDVVDLIANAIESGSPIGLFADFDVDGATSCAVMGRYLRACEIKSPFYIPDRSTEGYGPNLKGFEALRTQGAGLIIIMDCGITAHSVLTTAAAQGFKTIVIDHHEPDAAGLPPALGVINPKRADDHSGLSMLAACGVTFMTVVALNTVLRERGFFKKKGLAEPSVKDFLDLVALGTVCDMVPMVGINRLLVKTGLMRMNARLNPGIHALADNARIEGDITLTHLGFALGPRINAGSRVHQADLGATLLMTDDPLEALEIARILDVCNTKRKEIETEMIGQALRRIEAAGLDQEPVICIDDTGWHPGLSGLVAGRLKEKFGKPVCVIAYAAREDGTLEGRGSARSVPGVNIAQCFQDSLALGLVLKGGGHAMAGGFTLMPDQLPAFRVFLREAVIKQQSGAHPIDPQRIDALVTPAGLTVAAAQLIDDHLGPFGVGHAEPVFLLSQVLIRKYDWLGTAQQHARLFASDPAGGASVKAMAFRASGGPIGTALRDLSPDQPIDLIGKIKLDRWQGRLTPSFFVDDMVIERIPARIAKRA